MVNNPIRAALALLLCAVACGGDNPTEVDTQPPLQFTGRYEGRWFGTASGYGAWSGRSIMELTQTDTQFTGWIGTTDSNEVRNLGGSVTSASPHQVAATLSVTGETSLCPGQPYTYTGTVTLRLATATSGADSLAIAGASSGTYCETMAGTLNFEMVRQ